MTALWVSAATCVMAFGGGLLALRLHAYRGLVLAFCAGALVASALLDAIGKAPEDPAAQVSRFLRELRSAPAH